MTEFLHEVVRKRERNNYTRPSWLTESYNEMMRHMQESYQRMSVDMRAQEAIDRYMNETTNMPNPGMTMNMPVIPQTVEEYGRMSHVTYMFTGEATQGYRGWVRVN